jgi:hypothetical protein
MTETKMNLLSHIFCGLLLCLLPLGLNGCASLVYTTGDAAAAFQFEHDRGFEDHCRTGHSLYCKGE